MMYLVILLAFLADRLSKMWMAAYFIEHGPLVINRWLTLREVYNRGIAFGLFQGIGPLVGWLTIGVIIMLSITMHRLPRRQWLVRLGMALLIGGALGNLVDRIIFGQVLDFIETPLRQGIFNVADLLINGGALMALVGALIQNEEPPLSAETEAADETDNSIG